MNNNLPEGRNVWDEMERIEELVVRAHREQKEASDTDDDSVDKTLEENRELNHDVEPQSEQEEYEASEPNQN